MAITKQRFLKKLISEILECPEDQIPEYDSDCLIENRDNLNKYKHKFLMFAYYELNMLPVTPDQRNYILKETTDLKIHIPQLGKLPIRDVLNLLPNEVAVFDHTAYLKYWSDHHIYYPIDYNTGLRTDDPACQYAKRMKEMHGAKDEHPCVYCPMVGNVRIPPDCRRKHFDEYMELQQVHKALLRQKLEVPNEVTVRLEQYRDEIQNCPVREGVICM